ncbi:MAG: hypothetical protein K0U23_02070 [Gammaproteobacteria bacterium]|nr:hypothetical protein [Gammaproteobacteria bacterium]
MNRIVRFIFHLFAVMVVGYAVLLNLARVIVPQMNHQIPFYESWVGQALREPVKIHDIKAYWNGFGPEIHFNQVVVYKKENHKPLIKIQHLAMGVNIWLSLFEWRLVPSKLNIMGTHIDVYQNEQGQLQITGMPKLANNQHRYKGKLTDLLFWLLTEADIRVNHVDLSLHHVNGMDLELQNIQMRITNTLTQHHFSVAARLHQQQAANIKLIAYLQGASLQDDHLRAKVYLRLQHVVTSAVQGNLQAWLRLQRENRGWRIHADYARGQLRLPSLYDHPLVFDRVSGDFNWRSLAQGWSLASPSFYWTDGNLQQRGMFRLLKQAQHPLSLNLLSRFQINDVASMHQYVPQHEINQQLSQWLQTAFVAGTVPNGEFLLSGSHEQLFARIKQASLKFDPDWPTITNGDAVISFHDKHMRIDSDSAKISGIPLSHVQAWIPDLLHARLLIDGEAKGNLLQGRHFVAQTPLSFANDFNHVDLDGLFHLHLHLNACLYCDAITVHTQGLLSLQDASLSFPRWHIPLTKVNGTMSFADQNLTSNNLQGYIFNSPMHIQVSTDVEPSNQSTVEVLLASHLGKNEFSHMIPLLSPYIEGGSIFQVLLQLHDDANPLGNSITLASHLKGIALTHLPKSLLKKASEDVLSRVKVNFKNQQPMSLAIHYGKRLSLLARLKHNGWQISVASHLIEGSLLISQDFLSSWQAHLQHLYIPQLKQVASSNWRQRIKQLPSMRVSIADLHYGDTALGSLSFITKNQAQQLLVKKLRLQLPNQYDVNLTGDWHYAEPMSTDVSGWMMNANFAGLLQQLGYPKILSGGNGYLKGVLHWRGAPWQINPKSLQGKLAWHLKDGNVLKISQSTRDALGFAKLLNVLSFQSIMQNVSNSVNDESSTGFPFSSFEATLTLSEGVANLQQFILDGPVAEVLIGGRVGLLDKHYHLTITVRPYLTSSAPVIAGILGGPVAAAVAWAANKIIEPAVGRMVAYHYQLTGDWKHPKIKQVKEVKQIA